MNTILISQRKSHRMHSKLCWFFLVFILFISIPSNAERWTLVDFGINEETTDTLHSDWNNIFRDVSHTQFVDPNGNPNHQGLTEIEDVPEGQFAYYGIQGESPIAFETGHTIIATFYNRSTDTEYFYARLSFTDGNEPDPNDPSHVWYTMINPEGWETPPQSLVEVIHYISDESMLNHPNSTPSTGEHFQLNICKGMSNPNIVLSKIEWSNEADLQPPTPPSEVEVFPESTTTGNGQTVLRLNWRASEDLGEYATGVNRYLIYRNDELYDVVHREMIDYLGEENLHYIDLNVEPETTYTYSITALDSAPFGAYPTKSYPNRRNGNESERSENVTITSPEWNSSALINPWEQLDYLGGIRLPDQMEGYFDYASSGLAYVPEGNPGFNPVEEFAGSLYFLTQLNNEICEISIPKPVRSDSVDDLPRARLLQEPVNLWPAVYDGETVPHGGGMRAAGLTYHSGNSTIGGHLYYSICNSYNTDENAPSQGAFSLALDQAIGPWHIGGLPPNNVSPTLTSKILFAIPSAWAEAHVQGNRLMVGNTYISGSGVPSHGPSLYAVNPWPNGELPSQGEAIEAVELLRYSSGGTIENRNINWTMGQMGEGGAWFEVGKQQVVAISYRRSAG